MKMFKPLFLLILCGLSMSMFAAEAPFTGFDPNMSEEQLLNQLMEEINSVLPEDQREEFWEEVAKEAERLEEETAHMDPDEKEKYLLDLITAEPGKEVPKPTPAIEERPKEEKPVIEPKPVLPEEQIKHITKLLSSIVKSIASFLDKGAAFPDFDGKIERWAQQNLISNWQKDQGWHAFKFEINKFDVLLKITKEKDPKIGYRHLNELIKQETLINNLEQLQAKLAKQVPLIDVSPFAIAKMTPETKKAIQNTASALTEALYVLKIPEELRTTIQKFEPLAKKLREAEKQAEERAREELKRPVITRPTRVVGKPERIDDFKLPTLEDLGITDFRPGDRRAPVRPVKDEKKPKDKKPTPAKKPGAPKTKKEKEAEKKKKAEAEKKKKEEEERKKKEAEKKRKEKEKKIPTIKHPDVKSNVEGFKKDIQEAQTAILETPEFRDLRGYLTPEGSGQ